MTADDGFLTRWSRRKVQAQRTTDTAEPAAENAAPAAPESAAARTAAVAPLHAVPAPGLDSPPIDSTQPPPQAEPEPPPPTLAEAQSLTPDADFTRFVGRRVAPGVRNTALKTLFSDPRFNVMDGLDIYIDDYGRPDPLPPGMLRKMTQSALLGLFADERPAPAATVETPVAALAPTPPAPEAPTGDVAAAQPDTRLNEDTDLRLQPDDDAGRAGAEPGAGQDPGRQR